MKKCRMGNEKITIPRIQKVYKLTKVEAKLWKKTLRNLDTLKGYKTFYTLMKSVKYRNGDIKHLIDLAVSFSWDERFPRAIDKLSLADTKNK